MMKRHQPRWLIWLLILCVWMSGLSFVTAEEEETAPADAPESMVIAMDLNAGMVEKELYSAAMSLLKPGLTIAQLRKCQISVLDTVGDVKETYKGRDVDEAQKFLEHIGNGTISDVRQHLAKTAKDIGKFVSTGATGNLFMVSRLERLNRTSKQQASENDFYNAFKSLLDKAPGLSVHFIWLSDKKTGTAIDEELANAYPGRVTTIVLSRDTADKQTVQELTRMAGTTFTLQRSVDGMSVQDKTVTIPLTQEVTSDVLLQLVMDGKDPMPQDVTLTAVTPEGEAENAVTATPEVTEQPEATEAPTPEPAEDAATATPEAAELPEVEILDPIEIELPDDTATATPEATEQPDATETPTSEQKDDTATATPEATEQPEATATPTSELPEDAAIATPEVSDAPEATATPTSEQDDDAAIATPEVSEQPEATVTPEPSEEPIRALCIDERTHTVWFAAEQLPQGDYQLELSFRAETDGVQPTLTTYVLNKEPVVELSVEQVDGEPAQTWFHEPHTLTLTMDFPLIDQDGFTPALELQRLDGEAAETLPVTSAWVPTSGEDGSYRWQMTIPEETLPDEDNVQIQLRASVSCQEASNGPFQTEPLTVTVVNRAPVYVGDQAESNGKALVKQTAYYNISGHPEATQVSFELSGQAEDPDGDPLTYAIDETVSDSVRASCDLNSETGRLSVTLTDALIAMQTVTLPVTVKDSHEGSLQMEVVIRLQPFDSILTTFQLVPVRLNGESIPEGLASMTGTLGVNTLVYQLKGDLADYADARRQVPSIPPITEWIKLNMDENVVAKDEWHWNDGADSPELSLTLREITKNQTVSLNLEAVIPNQTDNTETPVAVPPFTITVKNNPPVRTEQAPSEAIARQVGIGGIPGRYKAMTFGQIFAGETAELSQLFTDKETQETLAYYVRTDAPVDPLRKTPDLDGVFSGGMPVYALEGTDDLLNIAVTQPGDYAFEVYAWDGEYVSEPVCYTVTVTSLFLRNLTIALIALAAALVLLIAGLALRYALLPSFAGMALDIDLDHRVATIGQPSVSYSTLALSSYRKKPVALMTALIASGQFPPSAVSPEALMDVMLLPGKNHTFGISVGSHAAQAGVCVRYGSQTLEGKGKLKRIAFQQPVQILMHQERMTLIVKAVRE